MGNLPKIDYEILKQALALQEEKNLKKQPKATANPNDVEEAITTLKFLHTLPDEKLIAAKGRACEILKTHALEKWEIHCKEKQ
jgi:hypothetical protein